MESGLDGRNNGRAKAYTERKVNLVSMESGLDGRNNKRGATRQETEHGAEVSMESGLDGRNNVAGPTGRSCENDSRVSMESGLDGRNNRRDSPRMRARTAWSQWSPA